MRAENRRPGRSKMNDALPFRDSDPVVSIKGSLVPGHSGEGQDDECTSAPFLRYVTTIDSNGLDIKPGRVKI